MAVTIRRRKIGIYRSNRLTQPAEVKTGTILFSPAPIVIEFRTAKGIHNGRNGIAASDPYPTYGIGRA
jgi:hypothetical protein